jgi:predicted nucleotidyltransferase
MRTEEHFKAFNERKAVVDWAMRHKLIAYAAHFASFVLENGAKPDRIILFGSVASGEFDKKSDIDLFIDTEKRTEKDILRLLNLFTRTFGEKWPLKGVRNEISLTMGRLHSKEWEDLRRSIQSRGIVLYGRYEEQPQHLSSYSLLILHFGDMSRAKKVSFWRRLYGYTQKVGNKTYASTGLLELLHGKKVEKGVVLVPSARLAEFKDVLKKEKVKYDSLELWTDQLQAPK